MESWGIALPFMDQWDGEALHLYQALLDGTFQLSALFTLHNEHRIVLTRLLDIALFCGTGTWSLWTQMVLNSLLHVGAAFLLLKFLLPGCRPRGALLLTLGTTLIFANPAGWQNALWGFQSQFYFCNFFAILATCAFAGRPRFGGKLWWLGLTALGGALLSMASGALVCASLLIVSVLDLFLHREALSWRRAGELAVLAALLLAALLSQAPHESPAGLRASALGYFFPTLLHCLAWPLMDYPWVGIFLHLPALSSLSWHLVHRKAPDPRVWAALTLWMFSLLNSLAISYARGGALIDHLPLSRYQDTLIVGLVANLFLLLRLQSYGLPRKYVAMLWLPIFSLGITLSAYKALAIRLPMQAHIQAIQRTAVFEYLDTKNISALAREPLILRPHWNPQVTQKVLDDPRLTAAWSGDPFKPAPWGPWTGPCLILAGLCCLVVPLLPKKQ